MQVRRVYVWGRFKEPKSKASNAPVPMYPLLAGFLLAWRERTKYARKQRLRVSQRKAERQEAALAINNLTRHDGSQQHMV